MPPNSPGPESEGVETQGGLQVQQALSPQKTPMNVVIGSPMGSVAEGHDEPDDAFVYLSHMVPADALPAVPFLKGTDDEKKLAITLLTSKIQKILEMDFSWTAMDTLPSVAVGPALLNLFALWYLHAMHSMSATPPCVS